MPFTFDLIEINKVRALAIRNRYSRQSFLSVTCTYVYLLLESYLQMCEESRYLLTVMYSII